MTADYSSNESKQALPVEYEESRQDQPPAEQQGSAFSLVNKVPIAVICGVEGWVDIEAFGKAKEEWLKTFLALPNGIPSHDTFGRVFARLDAQQFEQCFRELGPKLE